MHQLGDDHINNGVLLMEFEGNYEQWMRENEYHSYRCHYQILMSMLQVDLVKLHLEKYILFEIRVSFSVRAENRAGQSSMMTLKHVFDAVTASLSSITST
jgi:hypothetical protein